ncbi:CDP-alcohol phosphatidyltransferase family protein [Spongisporangium articulatum]|uniref:CDP-alcohol phosphatidyltransferase family protein n=1 Tax=Spongisporangium articulatum TaxID=3362603 RepID=A0ABW8AST6_9ACTN
MLTRDEYLVGWSVGHGVVPSRLVAGWLRAAYRVARPLTRLGVSPSAISVLGVALIGGGAFAAGRWPALGGLLIAAGGVCDGVDGAVALVAGRAGRRGALVDAACDRVGDLLLGVGLAAAGAPGWVCGTAVAVGFAHEGVRVVARRRRLRLGVTVSERPTRVIVTVMFLVAAGLGVLADAGWWASAGAWTSLLLAAAGLVQLLAKITASAR